MTIPRHIVTTDGRRARITGVSRRVSWDGEALRPRLMLGQPFNGGLFVTFENGATSFVANATYGEHWRFA